MAKTSGCSNCARLHVENTGLKARVALLEDEVRRGKRQATPFSKDKTAARPKRPGRRKGKGCFSRRKPPPEKETKTVRTPLNRCPDCGGPLEDKRTHKNIQSDIPRPVPQHTRFVTESGYCPHCRKRVRSRHPDQGSTAAGAASVSVGPVAKSIAADMHHRLGVPYGKVADHLRTVAGLEVTPSALCQSNERMADRLGEVYATLIDLMRQCCAVHADETGWKIGTLSAWLWVFTSDQMTIYTIEKSRGHEVVIRVLGKSFRGVLIGDCFLAYDHKDLAEWIKQKCYAHFLKDLRAMAAEKVRGAVRFPRAVAKVLREALALGKEKHRLSYVRFAEQRRQIEKRLDSLIDERRAFTDPDNARFAKRLRKQRNHLFTFLTYEGVQPTNNRAEQKIRPAVVARKTGACNKTEYGARTHSVIASVLVTAKQAGIDGVDYLTKVLTSPGQPPPLLLGPPASN